MICRYCQSEVDILDSICKTCGKSISILDSGENDFSVNPDSLLNKVSAEIENELATTKEGLFSSVEAQNGQMKSASVLKLKNLVSPEQKREFISEDRFELITTETDIIQIAQFVFYSKHVQSNQLYRLRAEQTSLVFLGENPIVNAFATDHAIPDLNVEPPFICIFGGLVNATKISSLALSYFRTERSDEARKILVDIIRGVGNSIIENNGLFHNESVHQIFNQYKQYFYHHNPAEIQGLAKSFTAAMNLSVIAHELGHIALGHTLGDRSNDEISRNQEREADSFASSVASSSPFSDHIVAGGIFWWVILSWVDAISGRIEVTTHPFSRDRLLDYIRANIDQAKLLGIDETSINDFLP